MALQLKFDPTLPHQLEAIRNVVDLFEGLAKAETSFQLSNEIVPNAPEGEDLADYWLSENLQAVMARHNAEHTEAPIANEGGRSLVFDDGLGLEGTSNDSHSCPHFTLEMETGTGKTYAYFRTMLELFQRYGLRKFIIVVPSVAILEGVKKTFEMIRSHLVELYGVTHFSLQEYDGAQLGRIGDFARRTSPVVMVITQQSFNKASNNFYKPTEKLPGERRPYQWIQATRPVVILDEPQNMGSDKAKEAIRTLKPLFVLRYSATHRAKEQPNPVYRLTPIQAFRHGLVKQIEVIGVAELGLSGAHLLRLEGVDRGPIRARVRALVLDRDGTTSEEVVTLKQGDLLQKHTKMPEHAGLTVAQITVGTEGEASTVEFTGGSEGGLVVSTADEVVGSRLDVWRAQIEKTIETHFTRQRALKARGIKVLSLFFIDRVNNYVDEPGTLRRLFDEAFERMKLRYPEWGHFSGAEVRAGYFASTKKKDKATKQERDVYLDEVDDNSKEAKDTFKLIMKDKERLLSFPDGKDPGRNVAFIFAHSALKEGWDNPNVFQICTLNQTTSSTKKRQEIGRGLRLCVDQEGNRPVDEGINILTVVANESYESYVKNLQQNYIDDGEVPTPTPKRQRDSEAKRQEGPYTSRAFREFWRRLCQRLEYTIEIDTPALVAACIRRLNTARFPAPVLTISKGRFVVVEYAVRVEKLLAPDRVQLAIEQRSNQGVPHPLLQQHPDLDEAVLKVGDDLAKLKKNQHFRGFKLVKVWSQYGETRARFANDVEISPSEVHRFQTTKLDDARETERATVAAPQPIPDFIGRAAGETHLTRQTLIEIFSGLSSDARTHLARNPEGWSNVFVHEVKQVLADHIAERLRYVSAEGTFADPENPDALFPLTVPAPQKEHIEGSAWSLYDKVQVDSDVERRFVAERLREDASVRLYFKFPPKFKIDLPRVIGDYNPDWGVVRILEEGGFAIELVRETKGNEDLSKLRFPNEVRKIRLAQRYFEQLGIDYRAVSPETEAPLESDRERTRRKPVQLRLAPRSLTPTGFRPVPVYDLKIAAGRFSAGQEPTVIQQALLPESVAFRPGLFIAQVVGDSMERVAADGRWCLWEHLGVVGVGQLATGLHFLFGRTGHPDPDLGEYTFKSYRRREDGRFVLRPMSYNPAHRDLEVDEENPPVPIARFVQVLRDEDLPSGEGTAP